jgi:putative protein kinase ArgK-like GTPase of G3E family
VKTVASEGKGISELASAIAGYELFLQKENLVLKRKVQNWHDRLLEMLRESLLDRARAEMSEAETERLAAEVAQHKRDPYTVVEEIVARVSREKLGSEK